MAIVGLSSAKVIKCPSAFQAECTSLQASTGALCHGCLCAEGCARSVQKLSKGQLSMLTTSQH